MNDSEFQEIFFRVLAREIFEAGNETEPSPVGLSSHRAVTSP